MTVSERILVCGSREWPGTWEDLAVHLPDDGDVTIIHGACSRVRRVGSVQCEVSVDMLIDFIARGLGFTVESYPVDEAIDGPWPKAGPNRNARMLRASNPDRCVAFGDLWRRRERGWAVTGTGGMVKLALGAGLPTLWVPRPGAASRAIMRMPGVGS